MNELARRIGKYPELIQKLAESQARKSSSATNNKNTGGISNSEKDGNESGNNEHCHDQGDEEEEDDDEEDEELNKVIIRIVLKFDIGIVRATVLDCIDDAKEAKGGVSFSESSEVLTALREGKRIFEATSATIGDVTIEDIYSANAMRGHVFAYNVNVGKEAYRQAQNTGVRIVHFDKVQVIFSLLSR